MHFLQLVSLVLSSVNQHRDLVAVLETGNLTVYSDACLRATVSLQFGCIFLRFTLAIANEHDAMTE